MKIKGVPSMDNKTVLMMIKCGYTTSEMARELNITRSGLFRHITRLRNLGLVEPHPCTWEVTERGEKYLD